MSNNELTPGITPITVKSLPPGASTPGQAAIANMNASNEKLLNINNIGGRRRRKLRGGSSQIAVPQHQMLYTPVGGPETDPNAQTASLTKTGTQSEAWAVDDSKAAIMGGKRKTRRSRKIRKSGKIRKGGNSNWNWGCYSGGRSRRRNNRKSHKRRTRRH
jgi:ribosome-associated protein YbcJ (S4-like RNA binding protein)